MTCGKDSYKDCKHPATNTSTSLPDELNTFYARFEVSGSSHAPAAETAEAHPLSVSVADVTRPLRRVNIRKAAGPDGIPGRVLKTCAHQLAGVFTDIFNLSLSLSVVSQCFKTSIIVPIQKTPKACALLLWHPSSVSALRSLSEITSAQFDYRNNRSMMIQWYNCLHPAHGSFPSRQEEHICENVVCWPQFSI